MVATPYPLPRSIRRSDILAGTGGTDYGPFGDGWGIFDTADVRAWVKRSPAAIFSAEPVTVEKTDPAAAYSTFTVSFQSPLTADDAFYVEGWRTPERSLAVTRGGQIDSLALEREITKIAIADQELRRDIDGFGDRVDDTVAELEARTLRIAASEGTTLAALPAARANGILAFGPDRQPTLLFQALAETSLASAEKLVFSEQFRQPGFTDQQTIEAFFAHLAANGGKGISIGHDYQLTARIQVTTSRVFYWEHLCDFTWTAAATSIGIKITVGNNVNTPSMSAMRIGRLLTEQTTGTALYVDNYLNLNPHLIAQWNYGPSNIAPAFIDGFTIKGATSVITDGFAYGIVTNCCAKQTLSRNYVTGMRSSDQIGLGIRGISTIWRNRVARTVTGFSVDAGTGVVTVTWSGSEFAPPPGELYVYFDSFDGDLGSAINGRSFSVTHDNGTQTLTIDDFDGRELPAFTTGGIIEQSPSHSGTNFIQNNVTWYGVGYYAAQTEGYWIEDNRAIGSHVGIMCEEQLGVIFAGFNHFNCTHRNIYIRRISEVYSSGTGLLFTRDPALKATGVNITKGATTAGSASVLPWQFYEGVWVQFDVAAGMTELDGNYYKIVNINRGVSPITFDLVDAVTGAAINSSGYGTWTSGDMYIVGEHIVLEDTYNYNLGDWSLNATGIQRHRGIRIKNCRTAGPSRIAGNRMMSGGCYAMIELEGTTNYVEIGDNQVFPNTVTQTVWNTASGTSIIYTNRKNQQPQTFSVGTEIINANGVGRTNGGMDTGVRFDLAGVAFLRQISNIANGRRFGVGNVTDPVGAGAGLAVLTHLSSAAAAGSKMAFPDRMPRFLLPGQHREFFYDETSGIWRPNQCDKWHDCFDWFSDFLVTTDFETATGGTTGAIATTGTDTNSQTRSPIGVLDLQTGTNSAGEASVGLFSNSLRLGIGSAFFLARPWVSAVSDGTNSYKALVGFHDAPVGTATPTDGVWWEYDHTASANWQYCAAKGGSVTKTASSLAVGTAGWFLGIFVNGDGTRADFIHSTDAVTWTLAGSITDTAKLPTGTDYVGFGAAIKKSAGTTSRSLYLDFMGAQISRARGNS